MKIKHPRLILAIAGVALLLTAWLFKAWPTLDEKARTSLTTMLLLFALTPIVSGPIRLGLWLWSQRNRKSALKANSRLNRAILAYWGGVILFTIVRHFGLLA